MSPEDILKALSQGAPIKMIDLNNLFGSPPKKFRNVFDEGRPASECESCGTRTYSSKEMTEHECQERTVFFGVYLDEYKNPVVCCVSKSYYLALEETFKKSGNRLQKVFAMIVYGVKLGRGTPGDIAAWIHSLGDDQDTAINKGKDCVDQIVKFHDKVKELVNYGR